MKPIFKTTAQTTEKEEQPTCPLCRSPLVREAIEAGKCQCCGHRFKPEDLKKS